MSAPQPDVAGHATTDNAYAAISSVVVRERQSRDRGWWAEMGACFTLAATVRLSWFDGGGSAFVEASRAMSARGDYAVHHLSAPALRIDGERALVELPVAIVFVSEIEGVPATLTSRARMQYRVERIEGEWLINRITSIYEYDALASRTGGELPSADVAALIGFRSSYCYLAWYMASKGYTIGDDLLGDDKPEAVASHYQAEYEWLIQAAR